MSHFLIILSVHITYLSFINGVIFFLKHLKHELIYFYSICYSFSILKIFNYSF